MKILDFITMVSVADWESSKLNYIQTYATDTDADVFAIEKNGYVVIYETNKVVPQAKDAKKYAMSAIGNIDSGLITCADKKEELIYLYSKLTAQKKVNLTSYSSNLCEKLKNEIKKLSFDEGQPQKQ